MSFKELRGLLNTNTVGVMGQMSPTSSHLRKEPVLMELLLSYSVLGYVLGFHFVFSFSYLLHIFSQQLHDVQIFLGIL